LQRFATRSDLARATGNDLAPRDLQTQANNDWQLLCSPEQFTSQRKAGRGLPEPQAHQGGLSPRFSFYVATCALLCQPDPPTRVPYSLPGGTGRGQLTTPDLRRDPRPLHQPHPPASPVRGSPGAGSGPPSISLDILDEVLVLWFGLE
jgi:hypothetical protein